MRHTTLFIACLLLLTSGCKQLSRSFGNTVDHIGSKLVFFEKRQQELVTKEVYCYRTLAQVDCYDVPQEGQEHRFMGKTTKVMRADQVNYYPGTEQGIDTVESHAPVPVEATTILPPPEVATDEPKDLIEFQIGEKTYTNKEMPQEKDLAF